MARVMSPQIQTGRVITVTEFRRLYGEWLNVDREIRPIVVGE